ncbi:MAG: carbohydrate porin [candidate division NC10 bacterium]|nr:carbohydrate porin [candidate division NC10 bacterium]
MIIGLRRTILITYALLACILPTLASAYEQDWNWHVQNTDVVQWHPRFPARFSGPQSLSETSAAEETVSVDVYGGIRVWDGAELYADGLMWHGFGLSDTHGVAGFPNGEAFRIGTNSLRGTLARMFVRHTIGLGGERETVEDDQLQLAGTRDISRITLTLGKISVKDLFDTNAYANDPRTQFLNWSLLANGAWDYPADSLGYTIGFAAELNRPNWAVRYGIFEVPKRLNGEAFDRHLLKAWSMVTEIERRYAVVGRPGTIRLLAYLTRAHMGRYQDALSAPTRPADTTPFRRNYHGKYGVGLNMDQELIEGVGVFMRLGWSDGQTDSWMFTDVDRTASLGASIKGRFWRRHDDTIGVGGVFNGITDVHRKYLAAGGLGILVGDGTLSYGWERLLEVYYDAALWKRLHAALDYQFIVNPAYNRDRGPASVFGMRVHWSY